MMKLLHCVLIMLNLLFVTGHKEYTQNLINEPLDDADGIVSLTNELKRNNKLQEGDKNETKGIIIMDNNNIALIYNKDNSRTFRRHITPVINFIQGLQGILNNNDENKYKIQYESKNFKVKLSGEIHKKLNNTTEDLNKSEIENEDIIKNVDNEEDINSDADIVDQSGQHESENDVADNHGFLNLKKFSSWDSGEDQYIFNIVNVTGHGDINDRYAETWDYIHPDIWTQSGQFKILNERGEVTGDINVENSEYDTDMRNLHRPPRGRKKDYDVSLWDPYSYERREKRKRWEAALKKKVYATVIVNITGNAQDVNVAKGPTLALNDPKLVMYSGKYKILGENGKVTGTIDISVRHFDPKDFEVWKENPLPLPPRRWRYIKNRHRDRKRRRKRRKRRKYRYYWE